MSDDNSGPEEQGHNPNDPSDAANPTSTAQAPVVVMDPDELLPSDAVPRIEEQDLASNWLSKGDAVVARQHVFADDGTLLPALITDFTISGINGSRVYGSPHFPDGVSQKDGWWFDLMRAAVALPDHLCEISANLSNGTNLILMGKGATWVRADSGLQVNPDDIVSFTVQE